MTGGYKEDEKPDKQDELIALNEKQKRFQKRYNELTKKTKLEPGATKTVIRTPKSQRLREIQYIFVIFKNCETANIIHTLIPEEANLLKQKRKECILFGKHPKIVPILEPDEIIWENLAYTKEQQKIRRYIMKVFSFNFLIVNTLFTMYLSGF